MMREAADDVTNRRELVWPIETLEIMRFKTIDGSVHRGLDLDRGSGMMKSGRLSRQQRVGREVGRDASSNVLRRTGCALSCRRAGSHYDVERCGLERTWHPKEVFLPNSLKLSRKKFHAWEVQYHRVEHCDQGETQARLW